MAKAAGAEMCNAYHKQYGDNFYSIVPPNLYGPYDNFRKGESHVVASLIRKVAEVKAGKSIDVWGTGTPKREIMHVYDVARAIEFCLIQVNAKDSINGIINAGSGDEISILELAEVICSFRKRKIDINLIDGPDGMPRKIMDSGWLKMLGWSGPTVGLSEGLRDTFYWYQRNKRNSPSVLRH